MLTQTLIPDPAPTFRMPLTASEAPNQSVRVLFFHEDRESRPHYLATLDSCGIRHRDLAASVPEAVRQLISTHYDLVLVTCHERNGRAERFIEEIKALDATAAIPLVALTADARPKNILRIRSHGVDEVLTMPLSRKLVGNTLERLILAPAGQETTACLRQAQQCLAENRLDDAESLFHSVLDRSWNHIEARIGLADIGLRRNETKSAAALLKKAMADAKALSDAVEQQRLLAQVYHRLGDFFARTQNHAQAVRHYQAALKINPFERSTLPQLLQVMAKIAPLAEILAFMDEIGGDFAPFSASMDQVASALADLADLYRAMNLRDDADTLIEYLIGIPHNQTALHLRVIDHLLKRQRLSMARDHLESCVVRLKDVDLLRRLADLYLEVRRARRAPRDAASEREALSGFAAETDPQLIERATRLYQEAQLLEPYDIQLWMKLLRCHLWRNAESSARELLERLAGVLDLDADLCAEIAETLIDEGAFDLAAPYVQDGIARYPESSRFHRLDARLHNAAGDHYQAIATLKRGLLCHANDADCLADLAATYGRIGRWSHAIDFYEQAQRARPDDPRIAVALQEALGAKYAS